jgi:hypothetical protein
MVCAYMYLSLDREERSLKMADVRKVLELSAPVNDDIK